MDLQQNPQLQFCNTLIFFFTLEFSALNSAEANLQPNPTEICTIWCGFATADLLGEMLLGTIRSISVPCARTLKEDPSALQTGLF